MSEYVRAIRYMLQALAAVLFAIAIVSVVLSWYREQCFDAPIELQAEDMELRDAVEAELTRREKEPR